MSGVFCWKCKKQVSDLPIKVGFRATCPHCSSDLHVCKNCRYYAIGKPNECMVPGTEPIRDREAANYCEEFKPMIPKEVPTSDLSKRLLGEVKKRDFNSLFKNEEDKK